MKEAHDGWRLLRMRDLLVTLPHGKQLQQGKSPQCHAQAAGANQWGVLKTTAIQFGSFHGEHNKLLPADKAVDTSIELRGGDIVITCAGPRARCGIPALVRQTRSKLLLSGKMYRFRANNKVISAELLELLLMTPKAQRDIDALKTGSSDSGLNLTQDRFLGLQLAVPPMAEQEQLVRFITEQQSALLGSHRNLQLARLRLQRMRTRVSADVWLAAERAGERVRVDHLGRVITGRTPASRIVDAWGSEIPFITPGDVAYGDEIRSTSRALRGSSSSSLPLIKRKSVQVVCIGATLGKVGWSGTDVVTNQQINSIEIDPTRALSEFVVEMMVAPQFQALLRSKASTTTIPLLNKSNFASLDFYLPPLATQHLLLERLKEEQRSCRRLSQALEKCISKANLLRISVLQSLELAGK